MRTSCSRRALATCFVLGAAAGCHPAPRGEVPRSERAAEARRDAHPATAETPVAEAAGDETVARHDEEEADEGEEGLDDDVEGAPAPDATILPPHPLASVSNADLEQRVRRDPASLGAMSIGKPSAGLLFNSVPMPAGDAWSLVDPSHAFGTDETVGYLQAAISQVAKDFAGSPKLMIGHISAKGGGYLKPHLSHQAGRDADIGYYYVGGSRWYQRGNAQNLDLDRTWALVRALVTQTDVEMLLIDRSIQDLLMEHAEKVGEDKEWVRFLFRGKGGVPPIVRHAPGHATHLHARFYNPIATETGRRCYAILVERGLVKPGAAYVVHLAKKGETLAELAKRYGTTVRAIRRANGLKSTVIQAKKTYKIPQSGHAPPALSAGPVGIPPRRLPPKGA
jgi:penicillin-insensitive murein endopeptidase